MLHTKYKIYSDRKVIVQRSTDSHTLPKDKSGNDEFLYANIKSGDFEDEAEVYSFFFYFRCLKIKKLDLYIELM